MHPLETAKAPHAISTGRKQPPPPTGEKGDQESDSVWAAVGLGPSPADLETGKAKPQRPSYTASCEGVKNGAEGNNFIFLIKRIKRHYVDFCPSLPDSQHNTDNKDTGLEVISRRIITAGESHERFLRGCDPEASELLAAGSEPWN